MSNVSNVFTGNSTYSSDFVQVIDRAVQIASLPLNQLNNQKSALSGEQTALSKLSTAFSSLDSALSSLDTAVDAGRYSVSYSDSTILNASASSGAFAGTYSVQIVDIGSQARANSTATVADPSQTTISSASSFTLVVNGKSYANIKPASNTLNSLADAINTATKGDVQATVVNVGSQTTPAYQLSIANTKYGTSTITLTGDAGNLLGDPAAANPVKYRINGQPSGDPLTADTRTLTIAPNIIVTALKAGTTDVVVGQSTTQIATALNGFVTAYNAVTKALDEHRGSSHGALTGQSIVATLSDAMRQMSGYTTTGTVRTISDIGLTFDKNGVLSFDASKLTSSALKDFQSITDFFGAISGTGGFLKSASVSLNNITNPTSGVMTTATNAVTREITSTDDAINDNQDRIDQLRQSLNAQMAAADALIASLQQQVAYFSSMFAAMQTSQESYR